MNSFFIFCTSGNSFLNVSFPLWGWAILLVNSIVFPAYVYYSVRKVKKLDNTIRLYNEELLATVRDIRGRQQEWQYKSDFQKKIIAAIVHGVKSPLKYMSLTGRQLLNRKELDGNLREIINSMYRSSHHLYAFTDNLLAYVKLYLHENKPVTTTFNLHELVDEKISIFRDIAVAKGCVINNHVHPNMNMSTDRQLLSIIMHNLIDNAVKFTAEGAVTLSAFITERGVHLAVQDTGIGMDEMLTAQLHGKSMDYEPGLGLAITHHLLNMIDGRLEIRSRMGEGSTIIIIFDQDV